MKLKKMYIRKSFILILISVLIFNLLGELQLVQAADVNEYVIFNGKLEETNQGFKKVSDVSPNVDSRIIEWELQGTGKYKMEYYVMDDNDDTRKIELIFDKKSQKEIGVNVSTYTELNQDIQNVYVTRTLKNTGGWDEEENKPSSTTSYQGELNPQGTVERFINIYVDNISINKNNLGIKFMTEGNKIIISTNGMTEGNISLFKFYYEDRQRGKSSYQFRGPKNYQITPFYLKEDNKTTGDNEADILGEYIKYSGSNLPGSKPFIELSYAPIKGVNESKGKFEVCKDIKIVNELIIEQGSRIKLEYTPIPTKSSNIEVSIDGVKSTINEAVKVTDDKIRIYISKQELDVASNLVIWDQMNWSQLIDSTFTMNYKDIAPTFQYYNKSGYTYLQFEMTKTPGGKKHNISVTPYLSSDDVTYYIYQSFSKVSLDKGNLYYDQTKDIPSGYQNYLSKKVQKANNNQKLTFELANPDQYVRIVAVSQGNVYFSQVVDCESSQVSIRPTEAYDIKASNISVLFNDKKKIPESISLDMEWGAPSNLVEDYLKRGELYYELILRTEDENKIIPGNSTEAVYSKIFKVTTKEVNGIEVPYLEVYKGTIKDTRSAEERYKDSKFNVQGVVLKPESDNELWEQVEIGKNNKDRENYWDIPTLELLQGSSYANSLGNKKIPDHYYLSFRTLFKEKESNIITQSDESASIVVPLNYTKEIIPVPTDINHSFGNDQYTISFKGVDIKNYKRIMLTPVDKYLYDKSKPDNTNYMGGYYEVYLSQSSAKDNGILELQIDKDNTKNLSLDENKLQHLRNGNSIKFLWSEEELSGTKEFNIQGLDSNTAYDIYIRTKVEIGKGGEKKNEDYSENSYVYSFTTNTAPVPPQPEDKVPLAPTSITVIGGLEAPNNTSVTLKWESPYIGNQSTVEEDKNQKIYYEIIRTEIENKPTKGNNIEEILNDNSSYVGFRTNSPNQDILNIQKYEKDVWSSLNPSQKSEDHTLTDDTLKTNSIYYYYIRTVCKLKNSKDILYSDWIGTSITTAPVPAPFNLKIEDAKDYKYDFKSEIIISFDMDIPKDASINTDYAVDIYIKSEHDEDFVSIKGTDLFLESYGPSNGMILDNGNRHMVYRISKLKHSTRYDIKVRIKDQTKPPEESAGNQLDYPSSGFSNIIIFRTEFDEYEQEQDNKYSDFLEKFDSEVEKLRRNSYWTLEEGKIYKYRESYIDAALGIGQLYQLENSESSNDMYYYMPATLFNKNNEFPTILEIIVGNERINIRPGTLTSESEAIKQAISMIENGKSKDYYVGIHVYSKVYKDTINGEKAVSPEINIQIELVHVSEQDRIIEDDIMIELEQIIKGERDEFIDELDKQRDRGKLLGEVVEGIVKEHIESIKEQHSKRAKKILDTKVKKETNVDTIEKPILIISKNDNFLVDAYYYQKEWNKLDSYSMGDGFVIEAVKLGKYIFTGRKSLIETLPEIAPYQNMINKYNLDEFFVLDSYMINTATTKEQLYGAIARITGATRGTDYIVYLKNRGFKGVSSIGTNKSIRQDEAIYIIMQGYEKMYYKPVTSVFIKNKQCVQNIGAFQTIYRPYVYAAVELKIVDNPNLTVLPSKELSVKETLKILYQLQNR